MMTIDGLNRIRDWLSGGGIGLQPDFMGIGIGSSTLQKANTVLDDEILPNGGSARNVLSSISTAQQEVTYEMILNSTQANGSSLKEVGMFNTISGLDMFARAVHTAFDKSDTLEVMYSYTFRVGD